MDNALTIQTERLDDIPVLLGLWTRMELPALLDAHFPTHGNWRGLSLGWVTVVWLTHLLSQADHRLNQVQDWACRLLVTLRRLVAPTLQPLDVSDDRLAVLLTAFSDDTRWAALEGALNTHLLRVYDLRPRSVRLDTTTALSYATLTDEGLLAFGHSKDHRPDLPQLKVALATLDPLALPLVSAVVPGNCADDPLYRPLITAVRQSVPGRGLLYVGDCKMAALATRGFLALGDDYYLCPLSATQMPPAALHEVIDLVAAGTQSVTHLARTSEAGQTATVAEGFERALVQEVQIDGMVHQWVERQLFVRSHSGAKSATTALRARLVAATTALRALPVPQQGKRRWATAQEITAAAKAVLDEHRVQGLLRVAVTTTRHTRTVRRYQARPAREEQWESYELSVEEENAAVTQAIARLGWRVYVTNQPAAELSLEQAVVAYRNEYLIEGQFARLKGAPLSLSPLYLHDDARRKGLVRLLSLALRGLALLEYEVARQVVASGEAVAGLYAGQPTRTTARPRAEKILAAFKGVTLTMIELGGQWHYHVTPLTRLQQRLLTLLNLPADLYEHRPAVCAKPP